AQVNLVGPKGYQPNNRCYAKAGAHSKVRLVHSIADGLEDANVIYTDTFVSMGRESSAEKRRKLFAPYQVNARMLKLAKPNAIVMHPLPAHRGEEITADVIDGRQSVVWEQARNKLLLEKALLVYLSNCR
ncbi:MAG: ornithine carbamoyltransferase, partial [Candidatus Micrarchaeaceae archaeon]